MVAGRDCLDEEALQGWVAGTLSPTDKARAQEHLAECDLCFCAVAEVHALSGAAPARPSQRYVLGVELGRGGMGVVYKAHDALLDRDVAVKVLHGAWDEPQLRERLVDESVAMARLRHPNIVAVHDVVIEPDAAFVVMDLVEGRTLRLWAESESRSPDMVLDTFVQIGEGLAAAHAAGVVHRDFKPDNVLVGADHRPQIADFGIASTMRSDAPAGGTQGYMAPEVLGGSTGDARADQYAFCVSLWEVLFGASPSARSGERRHRRIQSVLRRGLEEAPSDRFADMNALLARLRSARRSRRPWFAAAAICGALGAGVALLPASTAVPVCDRLALAEPSDDAVVAIMRTLRERDGLRGELLAQQAQHDVARIVARLNDASDEVCEAVEASPGVQAVADACIRDAAAELAFMLDHAERGDLGPLSDLPKLPTPGLCLPYARHDEARLPAALQRVAAARVRDDLTEATVLGRRYDERALPAGERVLASVRGWGRSDLEARAHAAIGWSRWDADPDAGREHFARATELADAHGHPALRARLWVTWGLLAMGSWDAPTVETCLARAQASLDPLEHSPLRETIETRVLILAMGSAFMAGNVEEARTLVADARTRVERLPDQVPAFAEFAVTLSHLEGDLEAGLADQNVLLTWKRTNGLTTAEDLARTLASLAELQLELGRFDEARRSVDEARTLVTNAGTPPLQRLDVDAVAARTAAEQGEFATAAALLAPHVEAARSATLDPNLGSMLIAWGKVLLLEGKFAEAEAALARATQLSGFDDPSAIGPAIDAIVPRAEALRRAGRTSDARETLSKALAWHAANYPNLVTTRRASLTMAWLDLHEGELPRARLSFDALRATLQHPMDRAWADIGFAVASAQERGTPTTTERSLVERAVESFAEHEAARGFELAFCEQWIAAQNASK